MPASWSATKALHDSVTLRRMYVTGGIGPSEHNEQAGNNVPLRDVALPAAATVQSRVDTALAGGVVRLTTEGLVRASASWDRRLYQPAPAAAGKRVSLTAVPYAIWGNCGAGDMIVWIRSSD